MEKSNFITFSINRILSTIVSLFNISRETDQPINLHLATHHIPHRHPT